MIGKFLVSMFGDRARLLPGLHPNTTVDWIPVDSDDPPGLPDKWRGGFTPGPWRQNDAPMNGLYLRHVPPAADTLPGQVDGMAVLDGWRVGYWRGPLALADWTHPLVSHWNQHLPGARLSFGWWLDAAEYGVDAVVGGWQPWCSVEATCRDVARYVDQVERSPLDLEWKVERRNILSVARKETLAELFPGQLSELQVRYRDVLLGAGHDDRYYRDVAPLVGYAAVRPADYLGDDGYRGLEDAPFAVEGLIRGLPPVTTCGTMMRPGSCQRHGSYPVGANT